MTRLPIEDILPDVLGALETQARLVVAAPPGSGKTTRLPLELLKASWAGGKIILLSPRRVAARAAAARMAATLAEDVGQTVGFRVRLESRVSARTRIEVVTEGVFAGMIQDDPALDGVSGVLFDEFHERSLDADLGLALALDAQEALRPDLRLVVMSATLDAARISALMGGAATLASDGRMHPVDVRYRPPAPRTPIEEAMRDAALAMLRAEDGSLLCFLPGVREIERTAELLAEAAREPGLDMRPLHGGLDPREQDAAIAPSPPGRRKIVLATSIAETSLTIDGVRVVIDSGLARKPRYEPGLGLTRLETRRVSRAAADQRAGRAGRTAPGVCVRLWQEPETRSLPAFDAPEITEADLTGFALELAVWGAAPEALALLDQPPPAAWRAARANLVALAAIDGEGRATEDGRRLARFGTHPALARMTLAAARQGQGRLSARLAVLLGEQGLGGRDPDARDRLARVETDRSARAAAARRAADALARRAGSGDEAIEIDRAGEVLALAFPDRIAMARGKPGEFLMANGRAAALDGAHPLARARFLCVAEASGRADSARIMLAAPIADDVFATRFGDRIEALEEAYLDPVSQSVRARRVRRLGAIVLSETPLARPSRERVAAILVAAVREGGLEALPWGEAGRQLRARVALLRRLDPERDWPDWSEAALLARLDAWLPSALGEATSLADIKGGDLCEALMAELDWTRRQELARRAPERFETPAGGSRAIDYADANGPAVEVRLQELFGLAVHPAIADGKAPLLLRLLSPAGRPVQTTRDLPGFWAGSYAAVRADLRGRYPKHPWPENPLEAQPTLRAKPRGGS